MPDTITLLSYGPLGIAIFCFLWISVAAVFTAVWKTKLENRVHNLELLSKNRKSDIKELEDKMEAGFKTQREALQEFSRELSDIKGQLKRMNGHPK